ncbi:YdiU family protein [Bacteriovorax sp. Seq25_V]|uniref:protein adenylyltransferase SelO n=1 Tax=Bacteriovorax sp. Seq25_V TaxID=1201288 RepID=UPI000389E405|nr:YdiU family protein [Bacteriovorax sp. Seq25_V]EQC47572.1 hypothetical protein M900_0509 [Bacteriovorax sp. Seq25_V]
MIKFNNSYTKLPEQFYGAATPSAAVMPRLIAVNDSLAKFLNIDLSSYSQDDLTGIFSGKLIPSGAEPIALAYSGHQFGHFNPTMGDGRAILIGEVIGSDGLQYDIQLKGSGKTPYSKRGDGRSWLGPVLREYVVSEAMYSLGIPTTRALGAAETGEDVYREDVLPGGVFTRVARSHIRVGTFEHFASRGDIQNLKILCDYAINRHDSDLNDHADKYNIFFDRIFKRKLDLVSKWMGVGFIHGVMNTDNTSISGETLDFGPCAFMDHFSYNKVFSSIDTHGRYAYSNQGRIAVWNLSVLANALFPLLQREGESQEEAVKRLESAFDDYSKYYDSKWLEVMGKKLGLFNATESDRPLIGQFLNYLEEHNQDFTNIFRSLNTLEFVDKEFEKEWLLRLDLQEKTQEEAISLMNSVNPYVIPRNHQIEKMIRLAVDGDYTLFEKLLKVLQNPYEENVSNLKFTLPPNNDEVVKRTFCGT